MMVGAPGFAVSGALLLMCEVLVLEGPTRAAQPAGRISRIQPVWVSASTATSRCAQVAWVKSIVIQADLVSATIRRGTAHRPDCLRLEPVVLRTRVSGSGEASGCGMDTGRTGRSATRTRS